MVMAVKLVHDPATQQIMIITGYEGGLTAVHLLPKDDDSAIGVAQLVYLSQPHTQPVLSLDVTPDVKTYFTSGADAIIAAHRIPDTLSKEEVVGTLSSSQEDRDDPPVAIPIPDPEPAPQVTSQSTLNSSHGVAQAEDPPISVPDDTTEPSLSFAKRSISSSVPTAGGLSSLLSTEASHTKAAQRSRPLPTLPTPTIQAPHKVNNTKHAGQQSLSVRSDGRLLVTGGWDSRVRIYSAKTLKEVAVLKWHKEGVYAVAFGKILEPGNLEHIVREDYLEEPGEVVRRETGLSKLQRQREEKMQIKHWVAAGAKDGKVSLWEVF
jgi:WD40 repeat protein